MFSMNLEKKSHLNLDIARKPHATINNLLRNQYACRMLGGIPENTSEATTGVFLKN